MLMIAMTALSGCASTSTTSTFSEPDAGGRSYSSFLVIGVAGDYDSRAQFERSVVSGLRAKGSSGSPYHVVAGGNNPVTRESVADAIASGGFDAVIVTRVLDTDSDIDVRSAVTGTKVTRKDGGLLDMFRYDYEEMNEPLAIEVNTRITFATELYDASSEQLIWSSESTGSPEEHIGLLIEDTAEIVVNQLDRNDFIRN